MKKTLCIAVVWLLTFTSYAQNREISGTVRESGGSPIPGANVFAPESQQGTSTDADGRFRLQVGPNAKYLLVSFVGMESQQVTLTAAAAYEIVMTASSNQLQEVVLLRLRTGQKQLLLVGILTKY